MHHNQHLACSHFVHHPASVVYDRPNVVCTFDVMDRCNEVYEDDLAEACREGARDAHLLNESGLQLFHEAHHEAYASGYNTTQVDCAVPLVVYH